MTIIFPMGQKMHKPSKAKKQHKPGTPSSLSHYQARNCQGCPLRGFCYKAKGNRSIEINHNLERHKEKVRKLLKSEMGIRKRKQRSAVVEPVFAQNETSQQF